jgi:hypothetical protein
MRRGGDIFSVYLPLVHAWMLERSVDACASGVVVMSCMPDLLTALVLALPILQEAVRAHLLSDVPTAPTALGRVTSVIAKTQVQTA